MGETTILGALARGLIAKAQPTLSGVDTNRGWFPLIRESFTGAWQRNITVTVETALANPVLFRCISKISGDIAKMRMKLVALDAGIWSEAESPAFSPVLRKPNRFQNRIQFFSSWMQSKLTTGNAVVLKERDSRGVVVRLYVLEWSRLRPLVAPNGEVYYQISQDDLSGVPAGLEAIPAREVIHDRWNTYFHPLVGLSPIFASGLAAIQGQEIQRNATTFFQNGSRPGGVLTAPEEISPEIAQRLKEYWETNFSGENAGKVAVLGDGMKYEAMAFTAHDSQLIEQLKMSAETICLSFGVPPYMAAAGAAAPLNNNVQSLTQQYYDDALQIHIESIELCLDEALGIGYGANTDGKTYGTEFDLDDLLRMDTKTQTEAIKIAVDASVMAPNEGRRKLGLKPVKGGDSPMAQQQQYSLAALAERDADKPFSKPTPAVPAAAPGEAGNDNLPADEAAAAMKAFLRSEIADIEARDAPRLLASPNETLLLTQPA